MEEKSLNLGECILNPEWEVTAIRYKDFYDLLVNLPYGSAVRVMTLMLFYTGCRVIELNKMYLSNLSGNTIYWHPGKNQKGFRKETLPEKFITELKYYRSVERCNSTQLFGINHISYRTLFNKLRPDIGGAWMVKEGKISCDPSKTAWKLQLKGARKTFQTILFKYFMDKYQDAGVAMEMISKRMRHSSRHMTAYHYIENYEVLDVDRWIDEFFCDKPRLESQTRLMEWDFSERHGKVKT